IRGAGPDKTILSFRGQDVGSEGLVATGNGFTIENLAVEDSVGNGIKTLGSQGVVFRKVRVEWTGGPDPDNGAYGLYPVQCQDVLIEDCTAIGASDAGIYVGQSERVIVRRCRATWNVAGIEIENTLDADVYDNVATGNTGGLLVFDLPGLQMKNGGRVRVYDNQLVDNNLKNFAPPGNMVATVPPGTGLMIMATDHVEAFKNTISNNGTLGVCVVSFLITQRPTNDPEFDPIPEAISIHDNTITGNGLKPGGEFGQTFAAVLGGKFPQLLYDGVVNPARLQDGAVPAEYQVKYENNGDVSFANFHLSDLTPANIATGKYKPETDLAPYTGKLAPLSLVKLRERPAPQPNGNPAVAVYRKTPRELSAWKLFAGQMSAQEPAANVIPYELNTPLFSDYTAKRRFIRLPEGSPMSYTATGVFDFPVGTVIAKTFSYPHDMRSPEAGELLLETRIEHRNEDGWYGFTYLWNEEQTEAYLSLGGGQRDVSWIHTDGSKRSLTYSFPNANQCISCHSRSGKFVPIGPTARNMNRPHPTASAGKSQLVHWEDQHWLTGLPPHADVAVLPRFDDPATGSVTDRARAWMQANCAHCHNSEGSARTSGLDLSYDQTDPAKFGVWKSPVATGRGSGGRKF
ncbi:MAG: right-handed parallel beta-helix repeat-containing protein, partial [Planctomycetaceae bacterium]|nr:right-handed parallel beta-helix repeat-containing protein [Planctomycetaceae bacterium]